jgi:hypothetical protein
VNRLVLAAAMVDKRDWWDAYLTADNVVKFVSVVLAAVIGAAIAAVVAVKAYKGQQKESRRQERAKLYAEALRAVEDYLEAPYRIMRRDGSALARRQLTESLSEIKSRISFYTGWLSINSPTEVYEEYCRYYQAAMREAGTQMTTAWHARPTRKDREVPIGRGLMQPGSAAAREQVLDAMKLCLNS